MAHDHPGPDRDRLLCARLTGVAYRRARFGGLTDAEKASGVAELQEAAGGRGDLLAEVAGLAIGTAEARGEDYEARGQAMAELCRLAGADEALIPQWTEEGRRRVAVRRMPPFSDPAPQVRPQGTTPLRRLRSRPPRPCPQAAAARGRGTCHSPRRM